MANHKITNVENAKISINSKNAISGSQLYNAMNNLKFWISIVIYVLTQFKLFISQINKVVLYNTHIFNNGLEAIT